MYSTNPQPNSPQGRVMLDTLDRVDTSIDIQAIEHLDFEPSCTWGHCENDAQWVVVYACCGALRMWCTPHLTKSQTPAIQYGHPAPWNCPTCGHKTEVSHPFPLASVEPL